MSRRNLVHFRPEHLTRMACGLGADIYPRAETIDDITCEHCRKAAVKAGGMTALARIATAAGLPSTAEVGEVEERVKFLAEHIACKHVWSQHEIDESHQRAEKLKREIAGWDEEAAAHLAALTRVAEAAGEMLVAHDRVRCVWPQAVALRTALAGLAKEGA